MQIEQHGTAVNTADNNNNEGFKVICHRCGNKWIYKGKSKFYANCSKCKTSINIRKFKPRTT